MEWWDEVEERAGRGRQGTHETELCYVIQSDHTEQKRGNKNSGIDRIRLDRKKQAMLRIVPV